MDYKETLNFALGKEIESERLYKDLLSKHPESKDIFLLLIDQEKKHQKLIQTLISQYASK